VTPFLASSVDYRTKGTPQPPADAVTYKVTNLVVGVGAEKKMKAAAWRVLPCGGTRSEKVVCHRSGNINYGFTYKNVKVVKKA